MDAGRRDNAAMNAGGSPADERHKPNPIDARVLSSDRMRDQLFFYLAIPGDVQVDVHWTGHFTGESNTKIPGSDFKIVDVTGHRVTGAIKADKLPSEAVRLFAPGVVH